MEEVEDVRQKREKNNWFDGECEGLIQEKNQAKMRISQRNTRATNKVSRSKRQAAKIVCGRKIEGKLKRETGKILRFLCLT